MSETEQNAMPTFELNLGDCVYDLNVLVHALSFAHDYVATEDIRNAAKNIAEPKLSPLTLRIEEALEMLQQMRERHGTPIPEGEGNPDDPSSADA